MRSVTILHEIKHIPGSYKHSELHVQVLYNIWFSFSSLWIPCLISWYKVRYRAIPIASGRHDRPNWCHTVPIAIGIDPVSISNHSFWTLAWQILSTPGMTERWCVALIRLMKSHKSGSERQPVKEMSFYLLNSDKGVEVSDTTGGDSRHNSRLQKKIL